MTQANVERREEVKVSLEILAMLVIIPLLAAAFSAAALARSLFRRRAMSSAATRRSANITAAKDCRAAATDSSG